MPDLLFFVELFFNNSNSILFSIVLFYILIHDVLPSNEKKQKVRKLNPPGPIGLPILGYLPFLSKFAHEDFVKLSAKYGPVFSLKLGRQNVVVLNDLTSAKNALSKECCQSRPEEMYFSIFVKPNLLMLMSGSIWKGQRRFSLKTLKNLGFGKKEFDSKINEEVEYLCEKIDDYNQESLLVKSLIGPSVSNVISLIVFGQRYNFDHPIRRMFDSFWIVDPKDNQFNFTSFHGYFPKIVRFLAAVFKSETIDSVKKLHQNITQHMKELIEDRDEKYDEQIRPKNFIDCYIHEIHKNEVKSVNFNLANADACATSFFGAGSTTTKDILEWFCLLISGHQEIQNWMHCEVQNVIGNAIITQQDRSRMPCTEAVLAEVLRYSSSIPINLPHMASEDCEISGYFIPKGTHILVNLYAIHHDPKVWGEDHDKFNPYRFLNQDHTRFIKNENLIPFGYGKRSCPAEFMATTEVFIYMTTLIQKYKVERIKPEMGNLGLKESEMNGFSLVPKDGLHVRFIPRG